MGSLATIGGIQTLIAYGRLTPVPGIFTLWDMALGDPVGGSGQRIIGARDVAPTSGYHAQGEFYFNIFNPGSGTLGWSCVTAGTPGTFTPVKFANPFVSGDWSDGTGIYIGDGISAFRLTNFSGQFYLQAGAIGGSGGTLNMGGMLGSGVLDVNVTGSLRQAGSQVWHAGNLSAFGISAAGYVPASGGGTANFLRADGSWAAPPSGSGTVTSASVVTANGVSGTVATATTTPAITLTLGAITPASVAAVGAVTGSNLSGSNSGDQTISLTGDVTGSGTGSFAATIGANKVSFAKFVAATQAAFVGATAAGNFAELTPATATVLLSAMGGSNGTVAGTKGLVPAPAIADNIKFLRGDGTWAAVAGGAGTVTSVSVATANGVSGSVATATSTPAITLTLGAITPTSVAATGTVAGSNLSGTNTGDQTITLTGDVSGTGTGSFATAIGANKITNAMLAQVTSATFHGRITAAVGNVETLTGTQATSLLDAVTSTTKGLAPASGGGTANFLRADGSWAAPPVGTGTVTSASVITANGISGSVATATTTPAITLTLGAITPTSVAATGALTSSGGGVGYATGAGGVVTQITSRTTGVTLSKLSGAITLFSTTTTAGQTTTVTVTNSQVAATDTVVVAQASGTGIYFCAVSKVIAGSFNLSVYTPAAVGTAEAPVLNFTVVKGVNA